VNGCATGDPGTGLGETLAIAGAGPGPGGAVTANPNCPDDCPSGLITSTLHWWAAVVNTGLSTIRVLLNELATRSGKLSPAVRSRNVTFAPLANPLPLIVNGCATGDPGTGLGETLAIAGAAAAWSRKS
jgi:hypothetical protein